MHSEKRFHLFKKCLVILEKFGRATFKTNFVELTKTNRQYKLFVSKLNKKIMPRKCILIGDLMY